MNTQADITQMFQNLGAQGVEATNTFIEELNKILKRQTERFIGTFSTDILIFVGSHMGGKFEELTKYNSVWKDTLGNSKLYRYEYRKEFKNIRCIFVLEEDGTCIFLKAFIEDGGKKKGSKSYNSNITLAVKDYSMRRDDGNE